MEDEKLIVPFEIENVHRTFLERFIHKLNIAIKAIIRYIFTMIISLIGIILLIPLSLLVSLRKVINRDETKLFELNEKIGKNGKIFKQITFGVKDDNYLMKTGLRHFPEVINIFLGQMSFVGPKAYNPEDKEKMGEYYNYIIQYKPGITGINQISSSDRLSLSDRLDNDYRYHYRKNFVLDLKIILITFLVTLRKKDAYYNIKDQIKQTINDFKTLFCETIKRTVDIFVGLIGTIIVIPLAILIKIGNMICGDFEHVFYTQKRIGKNGKYFYMYKFRTMVNNSQKVLEKILNENEEARKEWEANRKLKDDPRITKFGKFLRQTSLDEVPQFINVLKGEMSLVGPRAVVDDEIEKFGLYKEKILSVKPGITGYWGAHGRSNTSYDERVRMEAYYVDNSSFLLDMQILFDTVISVIKKEGAV